jgi:hypothetical protein
VVSNKKTGFPAGFAIGSPEADSLVFSDQLQLMDHRRLNELRIFCCDYSNITSSKLFVKWEVSFCVVNYLLLDRKYIAEPLRMSKGRVYVKLVLKRLPG